MPTIVPVTADAAISTSEPCSLHAPESSWMYHVQPSHELPTLDLSITLKSRFLSPAGRKRFDRCMRHRGWILIAYSCTVVLYFVTLVTPPAVGQVLASVGLLLGLPGTFFIMSALRYDTIRVLLPTYDILFFDTIVTTTLVVLMIMLFDARALIVVQSLVAYQINILIDANIQAVRRVAIVNAYAMVMTAFVGVWTALDLIPNLQHFVLFAYGKHKLEARSFVMDGFITILAIMARNSYRKRTVLLSRSKGTVVDCVSYRCHLTIRPVVQRHTLRAVDPSAPLTTEGPSRPGPTPPHIQTMRYVGGVPLIDSRRVLVPQCFKWLFEPAKARVTRLGFQLLGVVAASLTIGVGMYEFAELKLYAGSSPSFHTDEEGTHTQHIGVSVVVSAVLTLVYVMACAALYQRELLWALVSSFDFLFLSTQITFVHLATADFFRWQHNCVLLFTTWLWSHWVFCIDALTPIVRARMGLRAIFIKVVIMALVVSTGFLNNLLLFSDGQISIYDRVMWSGNVLGRQVEFRLLASFYSTYVTVMAWALRLFWRVFTAKRDELVLLDGAVAYDNYLRQPTKKLKSRFSLPRELVASGPPDAVKSTASPSAPKTCPSLVPKQPCRPE